jgi:23S rRNA (cytidine1920-2'-O)/16S rRNA (cytidine1409-2'-O)-methyltransferase
MSRKRADVRLVELALAPSREKAQNLIMAGVVYYGSRKIAKPSDIVNDNDALIVKSDPNPFVSRGGLKLQKAFETFNLDVRGETALDIGASTGGFTDCMLQHGAAKVYAVDVGYGQLDWKLRNDARVIVMERTNARLISPDWFCEPIQFACMDVSFISIRLILAPLINCMADCSDVVTLVKPQFEAGREKVGKNGVVRDKQVHFEVLNHVIEFARGIGFHILGLSYSPIKGPEGNIEFLLHLGVGDKKAELKIDAGEDYISQQTELAHYAL